jgi:2-polyprenyl-6-methoxyphenol hydroxylase-like FAD-dependent oxidoreductase
VSLKVIVAGGGIGGLTAAIALRQAGADATVFERVPEIKPLGAGLNLWSNGLRAFQQLGIADEVVKAGVPVELQTQYTHTGREISRWPLAEWSRQLGAPTIGIARPDLHAVLIRSLGEEHLELGRECTGYREEDGGVTATFADGSEAHGDVLITADGARSVLRDQLLGPSTPRYSGVTSWRAVFDFDAGHPEAPPGKLRLNWGRGTQFNFYRVGGGKLYWLALAKADEGGADASLAAVRSRFDHFYPTVLEIIDATPEDRINRTDIVDRKPIDVWVKGRVGLLGDAAHAMTPNLAQGACQAIEDGVVLAECLQGDPDAGLRAYQERRRARAAQFQKGSAQVTRLLAISNPLAVSARNAMLTFVMRKVAPKQTMRWMDEPF